MVNKGEGEALGEKGENQHLLSDCSEETYISWSILAQSRTDLSKNEARMPRIFSKIPNVVL